MEHLIGETLAAGTLKNESAASTGVLQVVIDLGAELLQRAPRK